MLDILIPVLDRPHRVEPLLENIADATDVPYRVLFLCSTGDREEIAAVKAAGAEYLTLRAPPARGQYAKKINQGYRSTDGERIFLGADDLRFGVGWATIASACDFDVVATNDFANSFVRQGLLATHSLVRRSYIEVYGGSLDGPGSIYHEGYSHNFVDCELSVLARHRGVFAFCRTAVVRHMHHGWGRSPNDHTYEIGSADFARDRDLFVERMVDYPRDRLVCRFCGATTPRIQAMSEISICIATYGPKKWEELATERAYPSAMQQNTHEVVVVHHPKGDVATSRNAAAEKATGEWLVYLDADDELGAGYIDAMEKAASQTHGQSLLLTPRVSYVIKGRTSRPKFWKTISFETGNWIVIGTCVERELFLKVGGFRPYVHGLEDWALWSECVKAGARIKKVPAAIYIAHWNDQSAHHQLRRDKKQFWIEYERTKKEVWG